MNLFEFEGKRPTVHPEAFVAPTATLIGDVTVEKGASVWYGAVLRADICAIVVREGANVQDNSVIHAAPDQVVEIGPGATVAHTCVVHGAVLEEKALLGNGSTMLDGARLGAGSMVAAGSLVTPGTTIPPGVLAAGPRTGEEADRGDLRTVLGGGEPALLCRARPAAQSGTHRPVEDISGCFVLAPTRRGVPCQGDPCSPARRRVRSPCSRSP